MTKISTDNLLNLLLIFFNLFVKFYLNLKFDIIFLIKLNNFEVEIYL